MNNVVERIEGKFSSGILLLCDHASNALPLGYGTLGLPPAQLERHIGYDIGAASVTRAMAAELGAPAVLSRFSRLFIDLNRGEDDPTLIMRLSDGAVIPGNAFLGPDEVNRRIQDYYRPYHEAIAQMIDAALDAGVPPIIVSIHSFTDQWRGKPRPWHAAVLWDKDPRLALPLLAALRREPGLVIGDNQPYSGALKGDTLYRHGTARGLAHALIEIRQDLIADETGQRAWSGRLARLLQEIMSDPAIAAQCRHIEFFGSRTDISPEEKTQPAMPDWVDGSGHHSMTVEEAKRQELEAAVFRRLITHLRERTDVQNIDMMTLAGFCRNCLANWYQEAAGERGLTLSKEEAREIIYGMPYDEWRAKYQTEASSEQLRKFDDAQKQHKH